MPGRGAVLVVAAGSRRWIPQPAWLPVFLSPNRAGPIQKALTGTTSPWHSWGNNVVCGLYRATIESRRRASGDWRISTALAERARRRPLLSRSAETVRVPIDVSFCSFIRLLGAIGAVSPAGSWTAGRGKDRVACACPADQNKKSLTRRSRLCHLCRTTTISGRE
jgi:hypothetical protein